MITIFNVLVSDFPKSLDHFISGLSHTVTKKNQLHFIRSHLPNAVELSDIANKNKISPVKFELQIK